MKVVGLVSCAAMLAGCATPPPFAATWYLVLPKQQDGPTADTGHIHVALLNQSRHVCTISAIELNGADDADPRGLPLILTNENAGFDDMPPGRTLVLRAEQLLRCTVPVRIVIRVQGDKCKAVDQFGRWSDPDIPLAAGFPTSLPHTWESDCASIPTQTSLP
jgi:hypothetical protein